MLESQASFWEGVGIHSMNQWENATTAMRRQTLSLLFLFQNLTLEGAHIVASDIASTNGIIHVIDKVYGCRGRICSSAPQTVENN